VTVSVGLRKRHSRHVTCRRARQDTLNFSFAFSRRLPNFPLLSSPSFLSISMRLSTHFFIHTPRRDRGERKDHAHTAHTHVDLRSGTTGTHMRLDWYAKLRRTDSQLAYTQSLAVFWCRLPQEVRSFSLSCPSICLRTETVQSVPRGLSSMFDAPLVMLCASDQNFSVSSSSGSESDGLTWGTVVGQS
jgi:hypothetical protein